MKSPRQEWYDESNESGIPWPELEAVVVAVRMARGYGKSMQGASIRESVIDELVEPLKKLAETLAKSIKPIAIPKFDPKIPTRPPHSMTPPNGRAFDRRGQKRY